MGDRIAEGQITLRAATPEDTEFLTRLYADTRRHEVGAWGWSAAQQEMFLRMQFDAQSRSYRANFPEAADSIVCMDGEPVGRILTGSGPAGMHLIDIALLEECRNRGVGTGLIRRLLEQCEAQGDVLRLQVLHANPARRLYERLGFVKVGGDSMYIQMEWAPPGRS